MDQNLNIYRITYTKILVPFLYKSESPSWIYYSNGIYFDKNYLSNIKETPDSLECLRDTVPYKKTRGGVFVEGHLCLRLSADHTL